MHIGGDKTVRDITSVGLQHTTVEKDVVVWISNDLKASSHVAKAVSKANQIVGLIRRTFTHIDCQLMKQLFVALIVRPHLEYGNVWHPCLEKDMQLLEGVQHRAVPGLSKLNYEQRLKLMDLPSLSYRRLRSDVIEVYNYMNGIYKVNSADILPCHRTTGPATRRHSLKLEKRDCKTRIRANFFRYRVVNIRNSLPEDVVTAS